MTTFCSLYKLCSLPTRRVYDSHNKYELFPLLYQTVGIIKDMESALCEAEAESLSYQCRFSEG